MNPIQNPFSPGAGTKPPELAGREPILEQARILLGRTRLKKPEKSIMLTGLRGVGKTVLLNEIQTLARQEQYRTAMLEAHEGKSLVELIVPAIRKMLLELRPTSQVIGEKLSHGFAVFRSFVSAVKIKIHDLSLGIDIKPAEGIADTGDLEIDLPELIAAVGMAGDEANRPVALFVDEIQYFEESELSALIMAMHRVQQQQVPFILVGAGLPILPGLAGKSKSYAERLFSFPVIGPLSEADSAKALREPLRAEGVTIDTDAVDEIYRLTKGYPYYLQEWGYHSWNRAAQSPITLDVVRDATNEAIDRLDSDFFRVRFDRCSEGEKQFLLSIAKLGPGPKKTSEIAEARRVKINSIGPMRANLIRKGMIYSPAHGEIDFTVPLFGDFMTRTMKKQ